MGGPSIYLAAEQLSLYVGKKITAVSGKHKNWQGTALRKKILSIFPCGKYLYIQYDASALRTQFLLFKSFQATEKRWPDRDGLTTL